MKCADWADYKFVCITTKGLSIQYEDLGPQYRIIGPDQNRINWEITLNKLLDDGTPNPDATDFETNVKPTARGIIAPQMHPFAKGIVQFSGDAVLATVPHGTAVNLDYKIDPAIFPNGAYTTGGDLLTQNSAFGDWIKAEVVDKDNVLGYGAGAILVTYVIKRYTEVPINSTATTIMELETDYAGLIPSGCYLRLIFTSTGSADVGVAINYDLHKPL